MTEAGLLRPARRRSLRRHGAAWPSAWAAAACAGLVTGLLLRVRDTPDVDLWLHLRTGDLLRSGERFGGPSDPLAVLADRQYVPSQWLSQVAMSVVHEAAGMAGIQVVRLLLVLALGAAVLLGCRTMAALTPALMGTALTMFAAAAAWGERPQLAGMALLAVVVAVWWRASENGAAPWAVVPLIWLWTMVHGSWLLGFAVGLVLLLGGLLDRCWRGRTLVLVGVVPVLSLVVGLLTPLGWDALLEPFRVSSVARLTANEWQSPAPDNPLLLLLLVAAVIALLGLVRSHDRRWTRTLSVVLAVALALWMVRTIAVGAIVLAPALAHGMSTLARRPSRQHTGPDTAPLGRPAARRAPVEWQVWALASALVLGLGGSHLATTKFEAPVSDRVSTSVASLPPSAVLAVDGRAVGWVQWTHRDRRPLRDLRAEVYSVPVATAYEAFQEARPGWQGYAESQGITAVLADRRRPLDPALASEPSWAAVAEDPDFRLWVHR